MTKNRRLFLPVLLILPLVGISLAYFFFTPSPADAFLNAPTPAVTQEDLWARVEIAKPTYTPFILPTETPTQILPATETPAVLAMEIVNEITVALEQAQQIEADPPPAPVYVGSKYILVDISDQHMYVYENDALIYSFVASTGINNATRVGVFAVQSKFDNAYGATWDIWMPNWLGIYWAGWKMESMPCRSCPTAQRCGKAFSADPFPMAVWCWARMNRSCSTIGLK